jgi:hypothetical protein
MPATSKKQQKFMAMCANNPSQANKPCPPKSVAKEFSYRQETRTAHNAQKKRGGVQYH